MMKFVCFIFLAVATLLCTTFVEQYEKIGDQMLISDWQISGAMGQTATTSNDDLYLSSKNGSNHIQISQDIPSFEPGDTLMLSGEIKYESIQPGKKLWNRARLLLVQNNGSKDIWTLPHSVASFSGSSDWEHYGKAFILGDDTKHIRVTAQLSRCIGSFWLKNLQLYPVQQTAIYTWVQRVMLFLWGLFAVFLLGTCFENGSSKMILKVLLVLSFSGIIIGIAMPQKIRNQVAPKIYSQATQKYYSQVQETGDDFQFGLTLHPAKLGHFAFFALFGALVFLLMKKSFTGCCIQYSIACRRN